MVPSSLRSGRRSVGVSRHGRCGEICPVGGLGNEDERFFALPPFAVVGLKELESDQFTLGSGNRLGRDCGKPVIF